MGIKDFFNRIILNSKEGNKDDNSIVKKEKKHQITKEIETASDGSKNIKLKLEGEKEALNIEISYGKTNTEDFLSEKRFYTGKCERDSYAFEYLDSKGEKHEGWTSESQDKYKRRRALEKIQREVSKITIKFEDKEYNSDELKDIYSQISERENEYNEIPEIIVSDNLLPHELEEVKKFKNEVEARKWKSRQRSLRRKGKLEQYKIDMLNKLGMIWNPKGVSGSSDEWESNYILFRKHGLCIDIKEWVEEQRAFYKENKIPNENLLRLNAVDFSFEILKNEKYKLTKRSCWELREKLDKKTQRFEIKEQKKYEIYEKKKSFYGTKKDKVEAKKSNKEVNSFYSRKYSYCSPSSINKLSQEEALKELSNIDKGVSYNDKRLKEFLDNESERFKKNHKRTPHYVKQFYDDISKNKISEDEIYNQLSLFNHREFDTEVRKKACHYMLKYVPSRNLKTTKFKEIDYLISIYKKEKNKTELIYLKDLIEKYPLLKELYGEKIINVILKLK